MGEKITLSGVPETMLQTIYARAKESRTRGAIHDEKAEAIMDLTMIFRLPKRTPRCTTVLSRAR